MNNKPINESLNKIQEYCFKEDYEGYSLYDSHNSPIAFQKLGKTISFYSNQIIKRSPVNIRPLIGVKKGINPKGMGLFLNAYCNIKKSNISMPDLHYKFGNIDQEIKFFFNWLKNNQSPGYKGYCWGYNYDWPKKDGSIVPSYTPSSVVTGFNIRAIFNYYLLYKDENAKDIINKAAQFILNEIHLTKRKEGICFSYIPIKRDLTINANLLAAEVLVYSDYVNNTSKYIDLLTKVLSFTEHHQNENGSWYYSVDIETGKPKKQIDFHQGYVLESIHNIIEYSNLNGYENMIRKGLDFYRNEQFTNEGQSLWRLPDKWPVDIHNQSQGIITFSKFSHIKEDYLAFAEKIANWTINNMQSSKGNFYYQKWPLITNKISYMRWNQGWMMVALSSLILKQNIVKDENIH